MISTGPRDWRDPVERGLDGGPVRHVDRHAQRGETLGFELLGHALGGVSR